MLVSGGYFVVEGVKRDRDLDVEISKTIIDTRVHQYDVTSPETVLESTRTRTPRSENLPY